ncbi:hypothetical protein BOQ62_16850, partial [Chryseobacterium sp. CH21]
FPSTSNAFGTRFKNFKGEASDAEDRSPARLGLCIHNSLHLSQEDWSSLPDLHSNHTYCRILIFHQLQMLLGQGLKILKVRQAMLKTVHQQD